MNLKNEVKKLVSQGMGRCRIERELNISNYQASRLIREAKEELGLPQLPGSTKLKTAVSVDPEDGSLYDLAKEFNQSIAAVRRNQKKENGTYFPAGDWVKAKTKNGIKLSILKDQLKITSKERAIEILKENFPDCFIMEHKLLDGDFLLRPVYDSKQKFEWLDIDVSKKPFTYFVSEQNNYMHVKFDDNLPGNEIKLYNLTDVHIGSRYHKDELFKSHVDMIRKDPMAFALTGGDLSEMITKISVADPYEQVLNNTDQVTEVVRTLLPIADKLVAARGGNHDSGRLEKAAQFDPSLLMATMLKMPYFGTRVVIGLEFRGIIKYVSLTHKYGSAHSIGAIENEVKKVRAYETIFVSAYFSGHNHKSFVIPEESLKLIPGKGYETERWWIINGGSYTIRTGSYAEKADYPPSPQDLTYYAFNDQGIDHPGSIPINCE